VSCGMQHGTGGCPHTAKESGYEHKIAGSPLPHTKMADPYGSAKLLGLLNTARTENVVTYVNM